jgi:hypothetical protein
MTRLILAAIAGLFAAFALAQSTAPPAAPTNKEKQEMVKDATAGAGKGYGQAAAEGSAKAAESRGTPKALPDKASKRNTVNAATANTAGKGYGTTAAEGSAKAAADTSPRKAKPKPKLNSPEMKEASKP